MSPSQKFNKPVIGIITTKEMTLRGSNGEEHTLPKDNYEVIEITDSFYVCNQWYKEDRVPQIIGLDMVESFNPII